MMRKFSVLVVALLLLLIAIISPAKAGSARLGNYVSGASASIVQSSTQYLSLNITALLDLTGESVYVANPPGFVGIRTERLRARYFDWAAVIDLYAEGRDDLGMVDQDGKWHWVYIPVQWTGQIWVGTHPDAPGWVYVFPLRQAVGSDPTGDHCRVAMRVTTEEWAEMFGKLEMRAWH